MKNIKKLIALFMAVCALFVIAAPVSVSAKVYLLPDGTQFDSDFYANTYPEMRAASSECKFADCRHIAEKQCRVRELIGDGIDEGRYDRYREFYEYLYSRRPNSAGGYK